MKQRAISGTIIALVCICSIYFGSKLFYALIDFVVLWSLYEFCNTRNRSINWFEFIIMGLFCLSVVFFYKKIVSLIILLIFGLSLLVIFDNKYTFVDLCISTTESIILGLFANQMITLENYNKYLLGYLVIIAYITDLFAYLIGSKFGKHKLNKRLSPKKSVEGLIGGYIFGAGLSLLFASFFDYFNPIGFKVILISSLTLPLVSVVGDLFFSSLKRHFDIKDYSNLIPGHGGMLDRIDSLIFTVLIFSSILVMVAQ